MNKHPIRFVILMSLLMHGFTQTYVLNMLDKRTASIKKYLSELERKQFVKDKSRTITLNGRKVSCKYKSITRKGVQWLIDNYSEEYKWLTYLPDPMPVFRMSKNLSPEDFHRTLKINIPPIVFTSIGIKTYSRPYEKEPEELSEYVRLAREQYKKQNGITEQQYYMSPVTNSIAVYFRSTDIKAELSYTQKELQQHMYSNYRGLLIVRSNSYLVYVTKPKGISITKKMVEITRVTVGGFVRRRNLTDEKWYVMKGIVFCRNEKEFADTLVNCYNEHSDDERLITAESLSGCFSHFYAIPVIKESKQLLFRILNSGGECTERIIEKLIKADEGFEETGIWSLPLEYYNKLVFIRV